MPKSGEPNRSPAPSGEKLAAFTPPNTIAAGQNGYTIALRREGKNVQVTFSSGSEYSSMLLFDTLTESARNGRFTFDLVLVRD